MATKNVRTLTEPSLEMRERPSNWVFLRSGGANGSSSNGSDELSGAPGTGGPSDRSRVATIAALLVLLVAGFALVGWAVGVHFIAEVMPGAARMKANTAIALLMLGSALWLVRREHASLLARRCSQALCVAAAALAILTLFQYLAGLDLGIDKLFVDESQDRYPGRMSPQTAMAVIACGGWLAMSGPSRQTRAIHLVGALSAFCVLALVIAWIYGAEYVYGTKQVAGVAPSVAFAFTALWTGILFVSPGSAWMTRLSSDRAGGHAMRRLVPAVILVVIGLGYLLTVGEREGLFSAAPPSFVLSRSGC